MLENLNAGCDCRSTLGLAGLLDLLAGPVGRGVRRALGERVSGLFQRENRSSEDWRGGFGLGSREGAKMGKVCGSFRAMVKKNKIKCFAFLQECV